MKYVIWDWNGTLFDDLDFCLESINLLLQRHGLKPYCGYGFQFDKTPYEGGLRIWSIIATRMCQDRCRLQKDALYTWTACNTLACGRLSCPYPNRGSWKPVRRLGVYDYF